MFKLKCTFCCSSARGTRLEKSTLTQSTPPKAHLGRESTASPGKALPAVRPEVTEPTEMWQKSKDTFVETQSLGLGRFLPHEYLAFSCALQSTQAWTTAAQTAPQLRRAGELREGLILAPGEHGRDVPCNTRRAPAPGTQHPCQALLAAAPLAEKGGSECSVWAQRHSENPIRCRCRTASPGCRGGNCTQHRET